MLLEELETEPCIWVQPRLIMITCLVVSLTWWRLCLQQVLSRQEQEGVSFAQRTQPSHQNVIA